MLNQEPRIHVPAMQHLAFDVIGELNKKKSSIANSNKSGAKRKSVSLIYLYVYSTLSWVQSEWCFSEMR